MRYLLLMYRDEKRWAEIPLPERQAAFQEAMRFSEELRTKGIFQGGAPLHPTTTARTVRVSNGRVVATDGPFAETKEQLGGYSVVEVRDLDEALSIALEHPLVRVGHHTIEVRPIREGPPR